MSGRGSPKCRGALITAGGPVYLCIAGKEHDTGWRFAASYNRRHLSPGGTDDCPLGALSARLRVCRPPVGAIGADPGEMERTPGGGGRRQVPWCTLKPPKSGPIREGGGPRRLGRMSRFFQKSIFPPVLVSVPEAGPDAQGSTVILPGIRCPGMDLDGEEVICAHALAYPLKYPPIITYIPRGLKSKGKSIVYRFFMFNYGN